jgi:hypothetical protein
LSGEYYSLLKTEDEYKKLIEDLLNLPINEINLAIKNSEELTVKKKLEDVLKFYEFYLSFINFLHDSLYNSNIVYISNKFEEYYYNNKTKWDDLFQVVTVPVTNKKEIIINNQNEYDLHFFIINLIIAKHDEGYICNYIVLEDLINLSSKLSCIPNAQDNFISEVIKDKTDILIYKILYRLTKSDNISKYIVYNKILGNITYTIDTENKLLIKSFDGTIEKESESNNIFINKYSESISKIYKIFEKYEDENGDDDFVDDYESDAKIFINELYVNKQTSDLKVEDAHYINKITKKYALKWIKNDETLFRNLLLLIKRIYKYLNSNNNIHNKFEHYGNESFIYLIKNSSFKIKFAQYFNQISSDIKIIDIVKIIDEITALVSNRYHEIERDRETININKIEDLVVNTKFQFICYINDISIRTIEKLEKTVNKIENIGEKKNLLEIVKAVRNLTSKVNKFSDLGVKEINSATKGRFMPLYLFKEECKVEINKTKYSESGYASDIPDYVLMDSAYVLPSNYEVLLRKIEIETNRLQAKDYLFRSEISRLILENYEDKLDDKVKDNQINTIQLIGLYAGFITFILGSISIVPKFEYNYANVLVFMFVFASCLALFALLLKLLFKKREYISYYFFKERTVSNTKFGGFFFLSIFIISILLIKNFIGDDHRFNSNKNTVTIKFDKNNDTLEITKDSTHTNSNYMLKEEEKKK